MCVPLASSEKVQSSSGSSSPCSSSSSSSDSAVVGPEGYWKDGAPTDKVVFFGDSDIDYWDISKDFPDAVNCGIAGATCRDAATHVAALVEAGRPKDFVVFISGENDIDSCRTPVEPIFKDLQKVVEVIIQSANKPRVIYISTKPEPATRKFHTLYERYDSLVKEYAAELASASPTPCLPPLVVIDAYQGFHALGNPRDLYQKDGLHLSGKGYDHLVRWVKAAMETP